MTRMIDWGAYVCREDELISIHSAPEKVREGGTPSPAPATGALPEKTAPAATIYRILVLDTGTA